MSTQNNWISADIPPTEAGEYLCVLRDLPTDDHRRWLERQPDWREVVEFKWKNKYKKTGGHWDIRLYEEQVIWWMVMEEIPENDGRTK